MVVIAAIGAFFKKIWDWIKQTAWIQPLLIVGIIFGVIFSIKPIIEAINNRSKDENSYVSFYHEFQASLSNGKESTADKITYALEDIMDGKEVDCPELNKLGDKFFLMYVSTTCEQCDAAKEGFKALQENMGPNDSSTFKSNDGTPFSMLTIFTDEETEETTKKKTAFVKYLERHESFFAEVAGRVWDTPNVEKGHVSTEYLTNMMDADPNDFRTPTILLVELGDYWKAAEANGAGVTEVTFSVEGEKAFDKAKSLLDCWNHEGNYSYNEKAK